MSTSRVNAVLLLVAMAAGLLLTGAVAKRNPAHEPSAVSATVEDATGGHVAVRQYVRIVSTSTIADQVLVELVDPRRLLAVSAHTLRGPDGPVYRDKIGVERARDIETIIELRPDIVFINSFVDERQIERLRNAGLTVFNLGVMRGVETLLMNIRQISAVLDVPQKGEALAGELMRGLREVSATLPVDQRERGLYVGIHGDRLYGGTRGTSFHDVLVAGGLDDVAAEAGFAGWPAYTNEQLLSLDPPWIITNPGTEQTLCRHPGFASLTACKAGRVQGIDTHLLTDPGFGMVDAARAVRKAVYGM